MAVLGTGTLLGRYQLEERIGAGGMAEVWRALDLGLNGRATNLPDGRVDVIAEGTAAALDALEVWLHQGPPAARVESVVREAWAGPVNEGFVTG